MTGIVDSFDSYLALLAVVSEQPVSPTSHVIVGWGLDRQETAYSKAFLYVLEQVPATTSLMVATARLLNDDRTRPEHVRRFVEQHQRTGD